MGDELRGHRSTRSSVGGHADIVRFGMDSYGRSDSSNVRHTSSLDVNLGENTSFVAPTVKSRRTLRQSRSMIVERKAYPLPDPSQFESPASINARPVSDDPLHDILYPLQSLKKERGKAQELDSPSARPPKTFNTDKQPFPGAYKADPHEVTSQAITAIDSTPVLATLHEDELVDITKKGEAAVQPIEGAKKVVVVVYDGEKKFSTAPLDIALEGYATAKGDAIVVVAFLEHVMSPMGMKMVADPKQFSGVNEGILKQAIFRKTSEIDTKLRDTNRSRMCRIKQIQLDVKLLPGFNPKALVAQEIIDSQATCVIFDKSAMTNRKYYKENVSCHMLRLSSDGRRVETISLFGQGVVAEKTGSITSHTGSDSSSDSSMNSEHIHAPSTWWKLKLFGSKRSAGSPRHQTSSVMSSSRTSSNLGSPRPQSVQEEDEPVPEVLEDSFSFDSPKPGPTEAYVYAAAGLDKLGTYTRSDRESLKQPTALAA